MSAGHSYYNECDGYAAQWLRNLIAEGHIAPGEVDERSIEDVLPSDVRGFSQCHFFAGIGVWSHALRCAGWPDHRPVWTGSCPCQPFSAAGKGLGFADERHLWPAWHHLIAECRPANLFGEQVASKDAGPWIDLVQDDLEGLGYAFGAVPFPAASVGAPHIRDRLYWVANSERSKWRSGVVGRGDDQPEVAGRAQGTGRSGGCEHAGRLAYPNGRHPSAERKQPSREHGQQPQDCSAGILARAKPDGLRIGWRAATDEPEQPSHWALCDWMPCRDGKSRPVEPGTFPLAHGVANRVGRLRAYGNAIVAPAAQCFIQAVMEAA